MSGTAWKLVLRASAEPSVLHPSDVELETTTLVEVECVADALPSLEARALFVAVVGGPSGALPPWRAIAPSHVSLSVVGDASGAGAEPSLDALDARPFPSLGAALTAVVAAAPASARARVILVVRAPTPESGDVLGAALQAADQRGLGVDIVATSALADLGACGRIVALDGGAVRLLDAGEPLGAALDARLELWAQAVWTSARLELDLTGSAYPTRLVRLDPTPVALPVNRALSGASAGRHIAGTERRVSLWVGPLAPGQRARFLVCLPTQRRRTGRYRLFEARLRSTGNAALEPRVLVVTQTCSDDPSGLWTEAQVTAARDHADLTLWLDDLVKASAETDHRRVAQTLDRLARRYVELGREADALQTAEVRGRYLRSGLLERRDINRLRACAARRP